MTQRKPAKRTAAAVLPAQRPTALLADLRELILQAREGVARAVDSGLTAILGGADDRFVSSANLYKVGRPQNPIVRPTK
jgi:hypothetical protein